MDTNPPPDDHWYYKLAERDDRNLIASLEATEHKLRDLGFLASGQPLMAFFSQPGGLIEENGVYRENPLAENIANLDGGYAYYFRQIPGKDSQWIRSQILGQYASYYDGRRVYEGYNDALHCQKVGPIEDLPLIIGMDYGLSPACAITQLMPTGALHAIAEVVAEDADAISFAENHLKPFLSLNFPRYQTLYCGDPAGVQRAQSNAKTVLRPWPPLGFSLRRLAPTTLPPAGMRSSTTSERWSTASRPFSWTRPARCFAAASMAATTSSAWLQARASTGTIRRRTLTAIPMMRYSTPVYGLRTIPVPEPVRRSRTLSSG